MKRFEIAPLRSVNPFALFDEFEKGFWPKNVRNFQADEMFPKLELWEENDVFFASVDIPGVDKDSINIDINDDIISVSGERKEEKKSEGYSEKYYGSFKRSFRVPNSYDLEKVEAHFENGVLSLAAPRIQESEKPVKRIEIKSERNGIFERQNPSS
ncbi:Hsp20/alpha crystallin family protein [Bacteriovorax sp. Seq25_V]|uniref:Hsp20/alpha crystallin family protein n=1 Tax=Bacteriovorax sp. Seq25_V TaxID=1201288 RepID=UPI00038A1047|nr:Hsp20/alpha crystallin family protein [Bacteriovorax sp. Seq25_V]EQC48007.1 Hsp20/alpha crystallin family protein [Bacteriovorax sp. Seq25_V]